MTGSIHVFKQTSRILGTFLVLAAAMAAPRAQSMTSPSNPTMLPQALARQTADGAEPRTYWRSTRDGWFWYQDPVPEEKPSPQDAPPAAAKPMSEQERDLAAHKEFQQKLENSLNAAVANPTEANLAQFLETWAQARSKASLFTDRAQLLAARTPWVDETAQGTRPPNAAALRVYDQVATDQKDDLMRRLATTHGLYFFFRSDCPYCHAQAPMLRQLEQKYGFTVFPVSLDGKGIPMYPQPARDNGISQQVMETLRIPEGHFQVPFTVLAEPRTRDLLPIGFGPMTAAEMTDRIAMLLRSRSELSTLLDGSGQSRPLSVAEQTTVFQR
jgi:conjugal transfer pilus assembly protein TraF